MYYLDESAKIYNIFSAGCTQGAHFKCHMCEFFSTCSTIMPFLQRKKKGHLVLFYGTTVEPLEMKEGLFMENREHPLHDTIEFSLNFSVSNFSPTGIGGEVLFVFFYVGVSLLRSSSPLGTTNFIDYRAPFW